MFSITNPKVVWTFLLPQGQVSLPFVPGHKVFPAAASLTCRGEAPALLWMLSEPHTFHRVNRLSWAKAHLLAVTQPPFAKLKGQSVFRFTW